MSLTAHFIQNDRPKFVIIGAKPAPGRHSADVLKLHLTEMLDEFEIPEEKMFQFITDAAEVNIKLCNDLHFRQLDCFAHKLNLVSSIIIYLNLFLILYSALLMDSKFWRSKINWKG
jgi:hypothetical protein